MLLLNFVGKSLLAHMTDAEIIDFFSVISEQNGKLFATATVTVNEDIGVNIPVNQNDIKKTSETGDT